jgi:lycopene cyclase domain-containing protein
MFGHATYLLFELAWAAPVLALHWALARHRLWAHRRLIALVALVATAYLCLADGVALHAGIWTVHANRTVGVALGPVPLEEIIFFLVTNLMEVQSVSLLEKRR